MGYNDLRQQYKPKRIAYLLVAESPPPAAGVQSSRHFYRSDKVRTDDRLFTNTIRALYPETADLGEPDLEQHKEQWLRRLQHDGFYMVEALEESQPHEVTKQRRQEKITAALPSLITRIKKLVTNDTKIILIKSNVFEVAAEPLKKAGLHVLNTELVDYPGQYNQRAYREKLAYLVHDN